jgi:hypothetical protein
MQHHHPFSLHAMIMRLDQLHALWSPVDLRWTWDRRLMTTAFPPPCPCNSGILSLAA